jgi:hypothetical protein
MFDRAKNAARKAAQWGTFGASSLLGGVALFGPAPEMVALLAGAGMALSGRWLWRSRRQGPRDALQRRALENVRALEAVAREDRISAPQMNRLVSLQYGLLESLELLPDEYEPLVEHEISEVVREIERMALLARKRSAIRRYLETMNRKGIQRRIKALEGEIAAQRDPALRSSFESALASRRGELAGYEEALNGIGVINAQLESAEALVSNLRGEVLALDAQGPRALESSLENLRDRVSLFRRSLNEVSEATEHLPESGHERGEISARG